MTYPVPAPGAGALYGKQIEPRVLARTFYHAGWQEVFDLTVAVMVCLAESQGFTHAIHHNPPTPEHPEGTFDRGPWQLNSIHKSITDEIAYDLELATAEAFKLYVAKQSSFYDWNAYKTGIYLHDSYHERAVRGVANFVSEDLLKIPVPPDKTGKPYESVLTVPLLDYRHRLVSSQRHVGTARKNLGWSAASKAKVATVQTELAASQVASKQALPS